MQLRPLVGLVLLFFCLSSASKPAETFSLPKDAKESNKTDHKTSVFNDELDVIEENANANSNLLKKKKRQTFYGYRQSFSGLLGLAQSSTATDRVFNFTYQLPTENYTAWEGSIEVISNGSGAFLFGYKYIFLHLNSFRPFVRGALAIQTDSNGDLASLLKLDNWRGVGTGGFEVLTSAPFSFRLEGEMSQGTSESALVVRAGISWGWY